MEFANAFGGAPDREWIGLAEAYHTYIHTRESVLARSQFFSLWSKSDTYTHGWSSVSSVTYFCLWWVLYISTIWFHVCQNHWNIMPFFPIIFCSGCVRSVVGSVGRSFGRRPRRRFYQNPINLLIVNSRYCPFIPLKWAQYFVVSFTF